MMKRIVTIILLFSQINLFAGCGCSGSSGSTTTPVNNARLTESREKTNLRNKITELNKKAQALRKNNKKQQVTRIQQRIAILNAKLLAMK